MLQIEEAENSGFERASQVLDGLQRRAFYRGLAWGIAATVAAVAVVWAVTGF